jgi:hypothetical protein
VIYHTSFPEPQYSQQSAFDAAQQLAQQIGAYSTILSNPNNPAAVPIMQQIAASINVTTVEHTLMGLAAGAAAASMYDLLSTVGISIELGSLGGFAF